MGSSNVPNSHTATNPSISATQIQKNRKSNMKEDQDKIETKLEVRLKERSAFFGGKGKFDGHKKIKSNILIKSRSLEEDVHDLFPSI
mmetsp:Transcript_23749/g.27360  ORF Transcript_23749/g.27360 Transcript_23749/m.27360 type:complete len:87 (+) Transcript_23749:706-966(+)